MQHKYRKITGKLLTFLLRDTDEAELCYLKWRKYFFFFVLVHALNAEELHNPVNMEKSENQNGRSDTQLCPKWLITRLFSASLSSPYPVSVLLT